jgi:hypothetical protein
VAITQARADKLTPSSPDADARRDWASAHAIVIGRIVRLRSVTAWFIQVENGSDRVNLPRPILIANSQMEPELNWISFPESSIIARASEPRRSGSSTAQISAWVSMIAFTSCTRRNHQAGHRNPERCRSRSHAGRQASGTRLDEQK